MPVQGVGDHHVVCFSQDNAVDAHGNRGASAKQSWTLKIGQPTVVGIGFAGRVASLHCHRTRVRVRGRVHWVTVRRHHKRVRVRRRARVKVIRVVRCQGIPRGRAHIIRQVPYGHGAEVSGWLGTAGGTALAGQTIRVLAAPDNGLGRFRVAAMAKTTANGSWSARLAPGPSRIVEARYSGGPTTESATSAAARLIVPAKVQLLGVSPRRVQWGGTVRITGRLVGGYLPAGGALVRLRIGSGSAYTTYGIQEHVTGNGRFSTTYTFGAGQASVRRAFWFQIASLPMGDYPFAPAASRRVGVVVGGRA